MNNMTATEVNRNFTAATKIADENGLLFIQKQNKDKYVLMTKERYDAMRNNVFYGRRGDELIKVEMKPGKVVTTQLNIYKGDDNLAGMLKTVIPEKGVKVSMQDGKLSTYASLKEMRASGITEKVSSEFQDLIMLDEEFDEFYESDEEGKKMWSVITEANAIIKEFEALPEESIWEADLTLMVPAAEGEEYNASHSLYR